MWRIWKSRNLLVYQKQNNSWRKDLKQAVMDAEEWTSILNSEEQPRNQNLHMRNSETHSHWTAPKPGWIIRDSQGFYLGAGQGLGRQVINVLEAELQALLMAMQHTWSCGYRRIIFEGDNQMVFKLLTGKVQNFKLHNWIRDIKWWGEKFESIEFQWAPQSCNKAADRLAREPLIPNNSFVFHFYVPYYLVQILHEDHNTLYLQHADVKKKK
ncbi:hypothetical protein EUTSA_v10019506mg [Eutrema salsugineum]|uniref:RNase H type-1 domain-containing protein n=1 Tax=Eutrema salsugineum TaxID=72664 RepID=V4JQY5_EUTSA|nr:hypothetical protein EUTSA_v10019506mg [Eutrema salsugineum]